MRLFKNSLKKRYICLNNYNAFIVSMLCTVVFCFSFLPKSYTKLKKIDGIAAVVQDKVINSSQVNQALKIQISMIVRDSSLNNSEKHKMIEKAKKEILDELIEQKIILAEFEKSGNVINPSYVDNKISEIIKTKFKNDKQLFQKELKKTGMTYEQLRNKHRELLVIQAMKSNIIKGIDSVTEKQIKRTYNKYRSRYRGEDSVKLMTIGIPRKMPSDLIKEKDQLRFAKEIRSKIMKGTSFSQMAKAYSVDVAKDKGGDRGLVKLSDLSGKMREIASKLESGQISEVIEISDYFYIIKVAKKIYGKSPSYKELHKKMEKLALQKLRREKYDKWMDRTKKKYFIKKMKNYL